MIWKNEGKDFLTIIQSSQSLLSFFYVFKERCITKYFLSKLYFSHRFFSQTKLFSPHEGNICLLSLFLFNILKNTAMLIFHSTSTKDQGSIYFWGIFKEWKWESYVQSSRVPSKLGNSPGWVTICRAIKNDEGIENKKIVLLQSYKGWESAFVIQTLKIDYYHCTTAIWQTLNIQTYIY